MTFWIIAAIVVVALLAVWLWADRHQPWAPGRKRHDQQWSSTEADHVARTQGGGGVGGSGIAGGGF